jgi:hypothetical protein
MNTLSRKHIISLSALMMFAPLIAYQEDHWKLNDEEFKFVREYIKLWYIVIFFVIVSFAISIIGNSMNIVYTNIISTGSMLVSIFLMIWWSMAILQDKQLWISGETYLIQSNLWNEDFTDLIPIYNLYQRYCQEKHIYLIKESIVIWSAFIIFISFFPFFWFVIWWISIIIIFTVKRLTKENIHDQWYNNIENSFQINIEEIYGKFLWLMIYNTNWLYSTIFKKPLSIEKNTNIDMYQSEYAILQQLNQQLIIEYAILWCVLARKIIIYVTTNQYYIRSRLELIPTAMIIARYSIMFYINQFVYIPIIHEIVWIAIKWFNFIYQSYSNEKTHL